MSHYRSMALLRSADGQPCANRRCGAHGTTVAAHINSVAHGKGIGIKAPDYYTAHLCARCHDLVDGRAGTLTKAEQRDLWMEAYLVTVERWFTMGLLHA